jgi:hypothetical protein
MHVYTRPPTSKILLNSSDEEGVKSVDNEGRTSFTNTTEVFSLFFPDI